MIEASFRTMALAILLTAAPSCAAAPPPSAASTPAPAAEAAVDAFHDALRRGDPDGALALMADEAIVFEDGRVERTKAEYALHHAGADATFSKAMATKRQSRTVQATADFALVATESRTKGSFRGAEIDRIMVETMALRRGPGGWRIVHIHWSSAQPATE